MLWRLTLLTAVAAGFAHAAILPESAGEFRRTSAAPVSSADPEIWREYGLQGAETATYQNGALTHQVSVWRMADTTGAMAAEQWQRRPGLRRIDNYLLETDAPASFRTLLIAGLPARNRASLPLLPGYLPRKNKVAGSERYVLGPASLTAFLPQIPPQVASFQFSTEAQVARYRTPGGEVILAVFSYPTPAISRSLVDDFQGVAGTRARQRGPLLVAASGNVPQTVLDELKDQVQYVATITENEGVRKPEGNPGEMLLAICILAGILIATSLAFGILLGGLRPVLARFGIVTAGDSFTALHLEDR